MSSTIIPHIIEQHAEELAFLWILRDHSLISPHFRLRPLVKLDNRVEAHVDGLRVAGQAGWERCEQNLELGGVGEVFAAATLALESKDVHKLTKIISLAENSEAATRGLISAFGWTDRSKLGGTVKYLLDSHASYHQLIGIAACAVHREYPGPILEKVVKDHGAPVALRVRALRAVGELKRRELYYELSDCFHHDDAAIRFWAAWSAVLVGNRGDALEVLKVFVTTAAAQFPKALPMLLRALPLANAHSFLKGLAQYPERQRDLVAGAGIIGDTLYIPWLIKQMETPELARLAGESLSFITGVDIAYENLDKDKPEDFESSPTENPEDESVAMDSDEDLPWPDPVKIQAWWNANEQNFQTGVRYLLGAPITEEQCRRVLAEGYQRQRIAAALELALLKKDEALFEVRAPGWRQQRILQSNLLN